MKYNITISDLRALNPCYDPALKFPEGWSGTLLDVIDRDSISDADKIWAVTKLLDEKIARLFAAHCAKEALQYVSDEKLKQTLSDTIEVSIRFANGEASEEERSAAHSAAESAAYSAARSTAWSAAWSAAHSAAHSAAESAAYSAAWSAAESAAHSAAWSEQIKQLRKMIVEANTKKGLSSRTDAQLLTLISRATAELARRATK